MSLSWFGSADVLHWSDGDVWTRINSANVERVCETKQTKNGGSEQKLVGWGVTKQIGEGRAQFDRDFSF